MFIFLISEDIALDPKLNTYFGNTLCDDIA